MCKFGLGSVTYAVLAQKALEKKGIYSGIIRLDTTASLNGCAYGIQTDCKNYKTASAILKKERITFKELN